MYFCCLACSWRVDEQPFENFQEEEFEETEHQQVTEEDKYIFLSYFVLITFIYYMHACIKLIGPYILIVHPCPWIAELLL